MKKRKLRNYRRDISNNQIIKKHKSGWTITAIQVYYGCSRNLVKRALQGKRPEAPKQKPIEKACSACNKRPIGPGKRFLCDYCFQHADDDINYTCSSKEFEQGEL